MILFRIKIIGHAERRSNLILSSVPLPDIAPVVKLTVKIFDSQETYHPLASRVRPETLEEFAGQEHLLGKGNAVDLIHKHHGLNSHPPVGFRLGHNFFDLLDPAGDRAEINKPGMGLMGNDPRKRSLPHPRRPPEDHRRYLIDISDDMVDMIARFANGDARMALNVLEMAVTNGEVTAEKTIITREALQQWDK